VVSLLVVLLLAVCLLPPRPASAGASAPPLPPADWLVEQVRTLSAPDNEGRAAGSAGGDLAARHIAEAFKAAGLRPGGDAGTYRQAFSVPTGIRLGTPNVLAIAGPAARDLVLGQDFAPLTISADGVAEGEVVFVGYGITAPALGHDDYAGLDVKGKIVLVVSGDPGITDPASPFRKPDAYHFSEHTHKVINAREHGAKGILLVTHPAAAGEALPALAGISQSASILAGFVTRSAADALLAPSGLSLVDHVRETEPARRARPSAPPGVRVRLEIALVRERGTATNVVGVLPGTDARLRDEAVVIGAHYDHLGRGGEGSLAPDQVGTIHPGADDNASGTAAVLALARAFAASGGTPRTLVFVAFSGEEVGLLGSAHYVQKPAHPLDRTVLMVNLDMVGRPREGRLYVGGVDSGSGLREAVTAATGAGLTLELSGDGFGPSDHTSFYGARRPVLFLFTGAHEDYHRPGDTWDKVDGPGLRAVTEFAARIVASVAAAPAPPAYAGPETAAAPPPRRGYGPYFGIIPDFGQTGTAGVKISGVRAGSPAERAGVAAGDVLVLFAGVTVKTMEDVAFALRSQRPGDTVRFTVLRDGAARQLQAVLEERR
jgi:hypothetical protein